MNVEDMARDYGTYRPTLCAALSNPGLTRLKLADHFAIQIERFAGFYNAYAHRDLRPVIAAWPVPTLVDASIFLKTQRDALGGWYGAAFTADGIEFDPAGMVTLYQRDGLGMVELWEELVIDLGHVLRCIRGRLDMFPVGRDLLRALAETILDLPNAHATLLKLLRRRTILTRPGIDTHDFEQTLLEAILEAYGRAKDHVHQGPIEVPAWWQIKDAPVLSPWATAQEIRRLLVPILSGEGEKLRDKAWRALRTNWETERRRQFIRGDVEEGPECPGCHRGRGRKTGRKHEGKWPFVCDNCGLGFRWSPARVRRTIALNLADPEVPPVAVTSELRPGADLSAMRHERGQAEFMPPAAPTDSVAEVMEDDLADASEEMRQIAGELYGERGRKLIDLCLQFGESKAAVTKAAGEIPIPRDVAYRWLTRMREVRKAKIDGAL